MDNNTFTPQPYDDYVQSANTLFHFMKEGKYLKDALERRALIPRYCVEDIEYLNIQVGGMSFPRIAVLQKCFCDIPFHKLLDAFKLDIVDGENVPLKDEDRRKLITGNTHPDFYGKYAIAFSKRWGERNNLHPIQYVNAHSTYTTEFSKLFPSLWEAEELPESYANDILNRLAYMKPLRGTMGRVLDGASGERLTIKMWKNFHDEREWRYVPSVRVTDDVEIRQIIANPSILQMMFIEDRINESLSTDRYKSIWLCYNYDDIRYILVPNLQARIDTIQTILDIPDDQFVNSEQKYILISKIVVLDELRKDL